MVWRMIQPDNKFSKWGGLQDSTNQKMTEMTSKIDTNNKKLTADITTLNKSQQALHTTLDSKFDSFERTQASGLALLLARMDAMATPPPQQPPGRGRHGGLLLQVLLLHQG